MGKVPLMKASARIAPRAEAYIFPGRESSKREWGWRPTPALRLRDEFGSVPMRTRGRNLDFRSCMVQGEPEGTPGSRDLRFTKKG